MQTTDPASQPGADEPIPALPAAPSPDEPSDNGHVPHGEGAEAYVAAWDTYARHEAGATTRRRREHNLRLAREVLETAIFALVMFLGVRTVVQNFRVEGLSMNPTYETGQYVLVNKALYSRLDLDGLSRWVPFWDSDNSGRYLFHAPRRGDVVVFEPPIANRGERDFIKRVIGEPGDHVQIRDGRVYVNDRELAEQYLARTQPPVQTTCLGQFCDVRLGEDEYYVLGDNRPNSSDSRFWGAVRGEAIIGKAWLIYLPFSDFGPAPNGAPAIADTPAPAP